MILDAIISAVVAVIDAFLDGIAIIVNEFLAQIPNPAPPDLSGMVASAAPLFGFAGWLNKYVPLDQAVVALGVLVAVWTVLYGIRVVVWALSKGHALGGGSN